MKKPIAVLMRLNGNLRSRRPPNALLPASAGPVPRTKVSGGSIQIPWWRHPNPLVSEGIRRASLVDLTRDPCLFDARLPTRLTRVTCRFDARRVPLGTGGFRCLDGGKRQKVQGRMRMSTRGLRPTFLALGSQRHCQQGILFPKPRFPLARHLIIEYTVLRSADWAVKTLSNGHTDYPRGRAASNRSRHRVWVASE